MDGKIIKWGEPGEKTDGEREDMVREIKARGSRDNGTRVNLFTNIQTDAIIIRAASRVEERVKKVEIYVCYFRVGG